MVWHSEQLFVSGLVCFIMYIIQTKCTEIEIRRRIPRNTFNYSILVYAKELIEISDMAKQY